MINLLPDDKKRDILAARTNVILLRYNILTLATLLFLAATCAFFYFVLQNAKIGATSTSSENAAKAQTYAKIRTAADEYRTNLTIANQILTNSVNYSSFLFDLTKLLPDGVVLNGISLNATSFTQQTTFVARAKSYEKATQLKENFQKSDLLTNVFFQNLTDSSASMSTPGIEYPIVVTISAKINKVGTPS